MHQRWGLVKSIHLVTFETLRPELLVKPYHFYMETLMGSRYTKGRGARARPGGLTAGAPIMRVRLVSNAGLVIVVLVSAGRVVAACEREDPLCEGSL